VQLPRLCTVVPALDEEAAIAAVVRGALGVSGDVIVVDNGSTDATPERARAAGATVVDEPERGYGAACLAGALAAPAGALLLYLDGDGSDDPSSLARVAEPVASGRARLALGSRTRGDREPGALHVHQLTANRVLAGLIRGIWKAPVTDIGPLRCIAREDLLRLDMRSRTYGWPIEMLVKAARAGLRIEEIPVTARRRAGGASKVSGSLSTSIRAGAHLGGALVRYGIGPRP